MAPERPLLAKATGLLTIHNALRKAAMARNFSWEASAKKYVALYKRAIAGLGRAVRTGAVIIPK